MIYVAKVEDETVTSVIVQHDDDEIDSGYVAVGNENTVGIGWKYQDGVFIAPDYEEESPA